MTKSHSSPPKMGNNGGTAFVRINGKRIYLGKFGSAEVAQNYARCVAEWANSNQLRYAAVKYSEIFFKRERNARMKAKLGSRTSLSYLVLFSQNHARLLFFASCLRNRKSDGSKFWNSMIDICYCARFLR